MTLYSLAPAIIQRLAWAPIRAGLTIFCSLEIRGLEYVRHAQGNVIVASNHSSELDPLVIVGCLPFFSPLLPLFFASREREFYKSMGWRHKLYGGTLFRLMGAYQVHTGLNDYEKALSSHFTFLADGKTVCLFPTGTFEKNGTVPKAKGGTCYLMERTHTKVLPVSIQGIAEMTLADFLMRKRTVTVTFGRPLSYADLSPESREGDNEYEKCAADLMSRISALTR